VTEGSVIPGNNNINDLFVLDDYVIRSEDGSDQTSLKIDKILSNPIECYSEMKKALETYSFPIWSKLVSEILEQK
jgi:hypothetical protein